MGYMEGLLTEEELNSIREEKVMRDAGMENASMAAAGLPLAAVPFLASCAPAN